MATKTPTEVVPVRLEVKVLNKLRSQAQQECRTVASLIRFAISQLLERKKL